MAIFNINGNGKGKYLITLHGGYGDVVTLTNVRTGRKYSNINLGSSMKKEIEIIGGIYTISSTYLDDNGISLPQIEFGRKNNIAYCYPKSAIFWYGNGDENGEGLYSKCGGFTDAYQYYYPVGATRGHSTTNTLTNDNSNFSMTMNANAPDGSIYYIGVMCMNMVKKISHSGYTKLKIKGSGSNSGTFYTTNVTPRNRDNGYEYIDEVKVKDGIMSLSTADYLAYYFKGQAAKIRGSLTIEAIWLE
jgi:hypothetical protein